VAITAALVAVLVVPASAAAVDAFLYFGDVSGTGHSRPGGTCLDCLPPSMEATAATFCSTLCPPNKPTSGEFTVSLAVRTYPPSPCKVQSVTGTLDVAWSDGTTSSAAVTGRFRDSRTLALSGAFPSTDAVYASDELTVLLDHFPPSPCVDATNAISGQFIVSAS
jgi:hypothetical protein